MKKQLYSLKKKLVTNRLFVDSFWSLLGNVIGRALSLFAGVFVAKYLGKDIYGEYGIIRNTILTIGVFSSFGLGYTATKYVAELKNKSEAKLLQFIKYALKITTVFCVVMAVFLFGGASYISEHILDAPHLKTALQILSILIVFNGLTTTQIGVLSGFGEFKKIARVNSITGVITFVTSIGFTYFYGLSGALFALLFSQIANWGMNYRLVRNKTSEIQQETQKDKKFLKEILAFSTPVALQEMVYTALALISNILLIKFATYGDLGMYSAAMQWNAIILFIPSILRNVVLSHLSMNLDDTNMYDKILKTTIIINVVATTIPAILVALLSSFIQKFYGETFVGLSSLVAVAVFITIFTSISNVYAQAYMSKGYNWLMLGLRTMRDSGTLGVFLIIMYHYNLNGAEAMVYSSMTLSIVFCFLIIIVYRYLTSRNKLL